MKINTYNYPQSGFLSVDKDLSIIVDMILKNNNLKKLLFYTSKDCLSKPKLTEDESLSLLGKQIKLLPKIYIDQETLIYMFVKMTNFLPNNTNPEFRDNTIEFDIICHYDQWMLKDFEQRVYKIAAELDTLFNNKRLTGIGKLQFSAASPILLTEEYGGFCMFYDAIHGNEDKQDTPNPIDQENFVNNFNEIFNND